MKSTGIVRKVDELGRIVIPIELRRNLDIEIKDPVEIFVDGPQIILRKYIRGCQFCGSMEAVFDVGKITICRDCASGIIKALAPGKATVPGEKG